MAPASSEPVMVNGKDVMKRNGKDPEDFARNIVRDIYTEDEIMSHRFSPKRCKGKNSLPALSPERKNTLKSELFLLRRVLLKHELARIKFSVERDFEVTTIL